MLTELVDHLLEFAVEILGHNDVSPGLASDGVAQVAAVDAGQTDLALLGGVPKDADQQLVGVGKSFVDVVAAVAALQAADLDAVSHLAGRTVARGVVDGHGGVDAAGAADAELALILVVEIEQDVAAEPFGRKTAGAGQTGLFVDGEQRLEGTVFDGVVGKDGQNGGHADAVVSTQRSAVGRQPLAVEHRLDGILHEVELLVAILLANHVHVSLEADPLRMLVAFRSRLANQDVAQFVVERFQTVVVTELLQVSRNLLFMF